MVWEFYKNKKIGFPCFLWHQVAERKKLWPEVDMWLMVTG
jgi:hypothetical protein